MKCWFGNATSKQCKTQLILQCRPLPEWARGLLLAREVTGSKPGPVGEECQNQLRSYCFAHFLNKIQKILDFFSLFLSSNIAPWVWAEWTNLNMCLNLVMQKIKIMKLFCLPEYSILIGRYETTGLRSIFTLLSPMWTIHFTLVLIQFICVACLLVCKYTNQKKVDLCTNSDWSLIYSGKKYCILIGWFDATFFQSLTRLYCISALISEATILLNWLES